MLVSRSPKQADSGPPATVADPEVPFGRYLLRTRLASGGMADVYAAELVAAAGFRKRVAIKRLRAPFLRNERYLQMFLAEARLGSGLSHPNLCEVYELGHAEGEYYIAMEYLHGVTLSTLTHACVGSGQQLPIPVVVGIIAQACEALHYAHEHRDIHGKPHGVIHRDVSPQNLMICDDGRVKLLDFGVAKDDESGHLTGAGTLKGKPCYMSPEQLYGEQLDRRTDLWSLGVVLFECLTGTRLFRRSSSSETISAITKEPIPSVAERRAGVPPALSNVVARALSRERDWRFATAIELRMALLKSIGNGACASREAIGALVRSACAPTLRARAHTFDEPPSPSTSPSSLPQHSGRESSGTRRRSTPLPDGLLADGSEAGSSATDQHRPQKSSIPDTVREGFTIAMRHQQTRSIPWAVRGFLAGFLIALVAGNAVLWDLQRPELAPATSERAEAVHARPAHALATPHEHSPATFRTEVPRQSPPLVDALKEAEPSEVLGPLPTGQAPRAHTIRPTSPAPRRVAMRRPSPSSFQKRLSEKPAPAKKAPADRR